MIAELYSQHDALGLAALVRRREVTPTELLEETIRRIEALNPRLNAVVHKLYDLGRRMASGELPDGPFRGVPFLLKDLSVEWQGVPVTNGCRYFKDWIARSNWALASRMQQAGLVVVGKTNVPENGYCASTEPALFGATINPWSPKIMPGGSSGGAAVAVAAGIVPMADASDGGGSIRGPASNNALVGLKPSRGRVTVGPHNVDYWYGAAVNLCVSRTVRDTAAYLDAVGGALPGDPYALPMPQRSYLSQVGAPPDTLRIGFIAAEPDGGKLSDEARIAVEVAARLCEELGHRVEPVDLRYDFPSDAFLRATATLSAAAFEGAAEETGRAVTPADVEPVTWAIIELGRRITGIQHANDIDTMRKFGRGIAQRCEPYDVVITPTQPQAPRAPGWYDMSSSDLPSFNAKLVRDLIYTAPCNFSGQPAISLPLTWTAEGYPMGTQFIARLGAEATLIRLASQIEQAQPWHGRRAPVSL